MSDLRVAEAGEERTAKFFGWISGHVKWITIGVAVTGMIPVRTSAMRSTAGSYS